MTQFRKEVNKILLFKAPALIPLEKLVRTQSVLIVLFIETLMIALGGQ